MAGQGAVGQRSSLDPAEESVRFPLDGDEGVPTAALSVALRWTGGSGPDLRGGLGERWSRGGGLAAVLVHAQGLVPELGEPLTAHPLRPLEAILAHEGGAAPFGPFAHRAAGRKRLSVVRQADGGVHAAQEEEQVWGAADADQRPELVHLQSHLLLGVMVELIRHVSQVVANALTHGDGDGLTHQVFGCSQRQTRTLDEQQQQLLQNPQPEQHESHCKEL